MVVAFVLMGCFAQQPLLFILGFAFWLGVCVAGMTLLRHFRASGTVVAGYTIGLATYGAMQHPELTFEHVIGRGSTVAIGVLCLSLVSMLLGTRDVHAKLEALVTRITADVARVIAAQRNSRRRPPTTSGTRCSPASTASTICSRSARPNRKISRSARPPCGTGWRRCSARSWAAHRRCRPTAPARKRSRRCSRVSRPRGRPPPTRWVKAPAVRRTRLRGWPMRAKACVWRSTVSRSAIRATKRRY